MSSTIFSTALRNRGISMATVARALNVDKSRVSRWASGDVPPERVPAIEEATGIPRHELRPDLWPAPKPSQEQST